MAGRKSPSRTTAEFERLLEAPDETRYTLRLYVTGMTPRSQRAIENIKAICEEHLAGRYELEVIDIYQHPTLADGEQIIAAPTLIKTLPAPLRRLVGDLSNTERILLGLDLRPSGKAGRGPSQAPQGRESA
jgi:circadian clock protein KaiB